MSRLYLRPTGAPPGGRVHWFLLCLDPKVRKRYVVSYEYSEHNYVLYRKNKRKLVSIILVVRTSKTAFRLMYHNENTGKTIYKSFQTAKKAALWVNSFLYHEEVDELIALEREELLTNFSKGLARLMRERRMSQSDVAYALGYRQQTVSKWIYKEYLPPNDVIEKIANFFGVEFEYFSKKK